VAELGQQATRYKECLCRIDTIASTDRVVFTERMDTVTMLADGRQVVARVNAIFELDDDTRVVAWREYWDVLSIARQVGVAAEAMPIVAQRVRHDR
jgi:limonene-1,2-epoxide hydrolase